MMVAWFAVIPIAWLVADLGLIATTGEDSIGWLLGHFGIGSSTVDPAPIPDMSMIDFLSTYSIEIMLIAFCVIMGILITISAFKTKGGA